MTTVLGRWRPVVPLAKTGLRPTSRVANAHAMLTLYNLLVYSKIKIIGESGQIRSLEI